MAKHKQLLSRLFIPMSLILALLLVGCGQKSLYEGLQEQEANEMIAILIRHNIEASKTAGAENTYNIMADGRYFAEAIEILSDYGYPKDPIEGLGKVFKKSGLVSSPTEERIRYMYALSQELQETLGHISGVLSARVHVVIPNNDPLADQIYPASASVFIKYRRNAGVENLAPQIKNLIVKSIEGLDYANVSLSLFPVQENDITAPAGEVPIVDPTRGQSDERMMIAVIIAAGIIVLGGAIAGFFFMQKKKDKKAPKSQTAGPNKAQAASQETKPEDEEEPQTS